MREEAGGDADLRLQTTYLVSPDDKQQGDSLGENQPNYQLCPHYLDLTELCNYYDFLLNLPLEVLLEAPQSQGKLKSPRRDGKKRASPVSKEANGIDGGQESSETKSLTGDTTNGDILFQIRGKILSLPVSLLLTWSVLSSFSASQ